MIYSTTAFVFLCTAEAIPYGKSFVVTDGNLKNIPSKLGIRYKRASVPKGQEAPQMLVKDIYFYVGHKSKPIDRKEFWICLCLCGNYNWLIITETLMASGYDYSTSSIIYTLNFSEEKYDNALLLKWQYNIT